MAFTQTDAAKLTRNMLVRGVIEVIITESAVLRYLPFVTVVGSGITYNQELTIGTAAFRAVGATWTEDAMTVQQQTAALKILGGDADLDTFLAQTYSNTNDIQAEVIEAKAKAVAYAFNDAFFNGTGAANSFSGLLTMAGTGGVNNAMTYSSTVRAASQGANGATLALDDLDIAIDAVKPGKPDVLFMSKRSRRKLSSLRRASGITMEATTDMFGRRVLTYDGIPIEVDENISDAETVGASNTCSSIYAVKFGFNVGICGLQNGGITVQKVGTLETMDAVRTRIKWYVGLANFRSWSLARFAGVK